MRLLHCGTPNQALLGDRRYFLNFTFCNPRTELRRINHRGGDDRINHRGGDDADFDPGADTSDLGHVPCIRPGYDRRRRHHWRDEARLGRAFRGASSSRLPRRRASSVRRYKRKMTLADFRAQLASAAPFADYGDGLGA